MSIYSLLGSPFILRGILRPRKLLGRRLAVNGPERLRVFQMDLCCANEYTRKASQICWCLKEPGILWLWMMLVISRTYYGVPAMVRMCERSYLLCRTLSSLKMCVFRVCIYCIAPNPCWHMLISFPSLIKQRNPNYSCWLLAWYMTFKFCFPQCFLWRPCAHTRGDRSAHPPGKHISW